jgi:hypothetical protein
VHVSDCWVKNGDDSICIKQGASHVLVENSHVEQGNGLVIGTGSLTRFKGLFPLFDVVDGNFQYKHHISQLYVFQHALWCEHQVQAQPDGLFEGRFV